MDKAYSVRGDIVVRLCRESNMNEPVSSGAIKTWWNITNTHSTEVIEREQVRV